MDFHETFSIFKCSDCGAVFVQPMPSDMELEKYYAGQYYEKPGFLQKFIQIMRLNKFSKMARGKLLDFGCGSGFFAKAMAENGWIASAIDVSDSSKQYFAKSKNPKFFSGTLKEAGFSKKTFDLIVAWHVFEHLKQPEKELKELGKILKDDGILMISVPNIDSVSFNLFKANWFHFDIPRHLIHYSPNSLKKLLEENGFVVEKANHLSFEFNFFGVLQSIYNALGFEYNLWHSIIKGKKPKAGKVQIALASILLPFISAISFVFSGIFSIAGKGDSMELYARKAAK